MSTHDSRLSEEHYALAKFVLGFLARQKGPVDNVAIFKKMLELSGEHQKKVMTFLRHRGLVKMSGRSRWAKYILSQEFLRGEAAMPPRLPVAWPIVKSSSVKKPSAKAKVAKGSVSQPWSALVFF